MNKLFLFDFDGVVVDSLDFYEGFVRKCLEEIGMPIVKEREDFIELFDDNFYESLEKRGVDTKRFNDAAKKVIGSVDYREVVPFTGLKPVLKELNGNNMLVVISSNSNYAINYMLSLYHYEECFDAVLGADFTLSKVDKITYALEEWNFERDDTYYIGDTVGDVKEAKSAGVNVVAVSWGWHSREHLQMSLPDLIIDSPSELLDL